MVEPPDIKIKKVVQKPKAEEKVEEKDKAERDDFIEWRNPEVLKNAYACRLLERFADSCCAEVQLYIIRRWLENARRFHLSRMNTLWIKGGGLGRVLEDLQKAERAILYIYGLNQEEK